MQGRLPLILIVDDELELRVLYRGLLKDHFRVAEAEDGDSGFTKAVELVPDLIVTDNCMPRSTGAQMVERIRKIPTLRRTPILVSSGRLDPDSRRRFTEQGVSCFLEKPFVAHELFDAIQNAITSKE